jgi:hypothetical protein
MEDVVFGLNKIFAALIVNAQQTALLVYQGKLGRPLTDEEVQEVATGVLNDIGYNIKQVVQMS